MLQDILKQRSIPPLPTDQPWDACKAQMMELLQTQVYGRPVPPMQPEIFVDASESICAGKGVHTSVTLGFPQIGFSFPIEVMRPKGQTNVPTFVFLNFMPDIYHKYLPLEEVLDAGFAVVRIFFKDVTSDDWSFTNRLAGALHIDRTDPTATGKIGLWAWAASRAMDYLQTTDWADLNNVAVLGHSRLGKTALWAGALDERFRYVFSNDSGCSGAAITRQKQGEHVKDICNVFGYWFCENYRAYMDNEDAMPFDQHFLLALCAPRIVSVHSALEDKWADPDSEYLSCVAASEAWEMLGKTGFVHPDRLPKTDDFFNDGSITYALRSGEHYLSRWDWQYYIKTIETHLTKS